MRYAVVGGDVRYAHLARLLQESGREAAGFFQEAAGGAARTPRELGGYDCIISPYPMRCLLAEEEPAEGQIVESIASGSVLLLCGPRFPKRRRWDLQYVNLWEDETLLRENAWLTAEAAVGTAMQRLQSAIVDLEIMVAGYGRIGRALTEILLGMNAKVTVATGRAQKRAQAQQSGAEAVLYAEMETVLKRQKLIFSTPPARVFTEEVLRHVDPSALLIDLASPPYGVDLEAAQRLKLCAVRESGLPGRWCPLSAARVLYNAVLRWEEEEKTC